MILLSKVYLPVEEERPEMRKNAKSKLSKLQEATEGSDKHQQQHDEGEEEQQPPLAAEAAREGVGEGGEEEEDGERASPRVLWPSFPLGRVKRIVKLDRDIRRVNSEALHLISLSANLLLGFLAGKAGKVALRNKKKSVRIDHLHATARDLQPTDDFLLDSLTQLQAHPILQSEARRAPSADKPLLPGARRIDAFFHRSSSAAIRVTEVKMLTFYCRFRPFSSIFQMGCTLQHLLDNGFDFIKSDQTRLDLVQIESSSFNGVVREQEKERADSTLLNGMLGGLRGPQNQMRFTVGPEIVRGAQDEGKLGTVVKYCELLQCYSARYSNVQRKRRGRGDSDMVGFDSSCYESTCVHASGNEAHVHWHPHRCGLDLSRLGGGSLCAARGCCTWVGSREEWRSSDSPGARVTRPAHVCRGGSWGFACLWRGVRGTETGSGMLAEDAYERHRMGNPHPSCFLSEHRELPMR
ncbi:hypothetical protein Taro_050576 [Colocasia esculenta]|uniref:Transcription factor CBF/NF-Y/archaeal histone domain-containing protein n=1 Tax=Colocasia esculenta TaxID=4460 RepID=A0A843XDS8_COLES|nr:hypothetical protein [Colocasia esculenta]